MGKYVTQQILARVALWVYCIASSAALCLAIGLIIRGYRTPFVATQVLTTVEPKWTVYKPVRRLTQRELSLNPVLVDVKAHIKNNSEQWPDQGTWIHEGTHEINSQLYNEYGRYGVYVLNDKAVLFSEPNTTLAGIAKKVPRCLRGQIFRLYLIESQRWWNNQPTYIFNEWIAYTNGATAKLEKSSLKFAWEFTIYAICVPMTANSTDPQIKAFLQWNIERLINIAPNAREEYAKDLKYADGAESVRHFAREYFGRAWTKKILGF